MRLGALVLGFASLIALAVIATPAHAAGDWGPDTCLDGFVWREANATDHTCVTGNVRAQTMFDTSQAAARRSPTGGPYGPDTCLAGFVWREAVPGDHVCVTSATRAQVLADNAAAADRRDSIYVWLGSYPYVGGGSRFRLFADHLNVGNARVEVRRLDNDALMVARTVTAVPIDNGAPGSRPGGRLSMDTDWVYCLNHPNNAYIRVQDPASGRWSARLPFTAGCAYL